MQPLHHWTRTSSPSRALRTEGASPDAYRIERILCMPKVIARIELAFPICKRFQSSELFVSQQTAHSARSRTILPYHQIWSEIRDSNPYIQFGRLTC